MHGAVGVCKRGRMAVRELGIDDSDSKGEGRQRLASCSTHELRAVLYSLAKMVAPSCLRELTAEFVMPVFSLV